jgi:hypothetical protein
MVIGHYEQRVAVCCEHDPRCFAVADRVRHLIESHLANVKNEQFIAASLG